MHAKLPPIVLWIAVMAAFGLAAYLAGSRSAQPSLPATVPDETAATPVLTKPELEPATTSPVEGVLTEQGPIAELLPLRELAESPQDFWTLFGQVRPRNGPPQAGTFKVWQSLDAAEASVTTLGTDGCYSIDLAPQPVLAIDVQLSLFQIPLREPQELPVPPDAGSIDRRVRFDVELDAPCEVHGVVLEAPSGTPIAGVPLKLRQSPPDNQGPGPTSSLVLSQRDGSFSLQLSATGPGLLEVWPVLEERLDTERAPMETLRRATRTRDGVPEKLARHNSILFRPRPRDASGERWPLQSEYPIELTEGGSIDLGRVFVGALGTLVIVADDPWHDGLPVAGERVQITCPVTRGLLLSDPMDGSGTTTLEFPPGHHRLRIAEPWTAIEPEEIDLAPGDSVRVRVHRGQHANFFAQMGTLIHFRVLTRQGFPMNDALVSLSGQEVSTSGGGHAALSCGDEGLSGELVVTHAAIGRYVRKDFQADAGTHHDVEVDTRNALLLRVLDARSNPVTKVELIWIERLMDRSKAWPRSSFTSQSNDGAYSVDLPASERGVLGLFVRAKQGAGLLWLGSGVLPSREEMLILSTLLEVSGTVVDESGSLVKGATVVVSMPELAVNLQGSWAEIDRALTSANGRFKLRILETGGTVSVMADDASSLWKQFAHGDELLQLTLSPPLRVSLLRPTGISGPLMCGLWPHDGDFEFQLSQEWSDDQQTWLVALPNPGAYTIRWSHDLLTQHEETFDVQEDGQQIQLKRELP